MAVTIPFAGWTPDLPDYGNDGTTTAKNVLPVARGFQRVPSLTAASTAQTAYCRGAFSAMDSTGNVALYSGDETKLYRLVSTTLTDSSKVGGYACALDSFWAFAKFGNTVIASNFDDTPQVITIGGTQFADLSGTPPNFRHLAVVGNFLIVANTFDGTDGAVPNRVRWPGIGTTTSWTVSSTTQADYQDLESNGGWVQAVASVQGRGVIFQERAVWLMTYVGGATVFQFDLLEDSRGAFASRSVIAVGPTIYYLADDGFYAFVGGQSIPIGANKVDRTFLADLNDDYLHRVSALAFPQEKIVMWGYPGSGSSDGTPNKYIAYNWSTQTWSHGEFDHELLFRALTVGVTLDGLDALGYTDLDNLPFSLDSRAWMGGALVEAAFNTDHKLAYFTGSALAATLETGESRFLPNQRANVTAARPLVDGGTHTVQMGTRETQAGTVSWASAVAENASGICPVRSNSHYHRIRVNITGEFTDAIGVEIPDAAVASAGER